MKLPATAAILGLGLMGGSLARDLVARRVRVLGYDADPGVLHAALGDGVLHGTLDDSLAGLDEAGLVVVATPVDAVASLLSRLAPRLSAEAFVTDVGSTKQAIVEHAEGAGLGERFVGSHPLAGDHRSGWGATRDGLYAGVRVFITPGPRSAPAAVEAIEGLWTALGAACTRIGAEEHDRRMAWASHLPQVASSAVAGALWPAGLTPGDLGPGGRDVTRLAASSPEMWAAICLANAAHLEPAVAAVSERTERFLTALRARDADALLDFFRAGRHTPA